MNRELDGLSGEVVRLLKERGMTVATVESCTGGMVGALLTDIPGASEVFKGGFITYSDETKHRFVGVRTETLRQYTAVSEETAREMVLGGRKKNRSRGGRQRYRLCRTGRRQPAGAGGTGLYRLRSGRECFGKTFSVPGKPQASPGAGGGGSAAVPAGTSFGGRACKGSAKYRGIR